MDKNSVGVGIRPRKGNVASTILAIGTLLALTSIASTYAAINTNVAAIDVDVAMAAIATVCFHSPVGTVATPPCFQKHERGRHKY